MNASVPPNVVKPEAAFQPLLSLMQLARRAREASEPSELGFVMVNESLQLLPYRQAALWTETGLKRVSAVSGLPEPDPQAPYLQWLGGLFKHPPASPEKVQAVRADQFPGATGEQWADWLPAHAAWVPLRSRDQSLGVLLLAREEPWADRELAMLQELAHAYGHALAAFLPRQGLIDRWSAGLRTSRVRRYVLFGALAVCLLPVRLSVPAPAEVVPHQPSLVRAPLDGVIEQVLVRPNQAVKAGDALFSLDTTALQARHDMASKAFDAAQEELRQAAQSAVTEDRSRVEVAMRRNQLREREVELSFSERQLARIQVKAERDGVAVFADVNDWMGRAVAVGERVMQVADPTQVELVAHLPSADQIPVAPGDTLTFYPQGAPLQTHQATVTSVSYRAEPTPDGYLAYRIKASFAAGDAAPQLGQLGTARLTGQWAPLSYLALRRPLAAARQWLGW